MTVKNIQIDEGLHKRVKLTATMHGISIREWAEQVISDALEGKPSSSVLVDTKEQYGVGTSDG